VLQDSPVRKEDRPVAFVAAHERQRRSTRVSHVGRDVQQVFESPERRAGHGGRLALADEEERAREGHEDLQQRAAKDHRVVAHPTEDRVTHFVDHQVGVVEKQEAARARPRVEHERGVGHTPSDRGRARHRSETVFGE